MNIFKLLGALMVPAIAVGGTALVVLGVIDHRDGLAIAGAIMVGALAIAGQAAALNRRRS